MRENRPYGLEGGESGSTGLPYPYRAGGSHLSEAGEAIESFAMLNPNATQLHRTQSSAKNDEQR